MQIAIYLINNGHNFEAKHCLNDASNKPTANLIVLWNYFKMYNFF